MLLPVYIYGSSVLRRESADVEKDYPGLDKLIENMFETMYHSDGVGLAAPQVGENLRLFVVDSSPMADDEPQAANYKRAFINPEIIEESDDEVLMNEGCLSLPGIHEDVYRPETIKVHYFDENFVEHIDELDGWRARIVQHEYDHIEGMVFTDHLSALRKTLLRNKLASMSKGKYSAAYKTKLIK